MSDLLDRLPRLLFFGCLGLAALGGAFVYGAVAFRADLFPMPQARQAYQMVSEVFWPSDRVLKTTGTVYTEPIATLQPGQLEPGLVMVAGALEPRETAVRIVDRSGRVIHAWTPSWSDIWPENEGDFPFRPDAGMYLHGVDVLPDGSLVANFEHQSTFRLDVCGNVLWKLDNLGHHSVHFAEDDTLWVPAEVNIPNGPTGYPYHEAPLRSWTLQNIDLEGTILRTIPVIDIFLENDLEGLLYLSTRRNLAPIVRGDTLHLNDIETFPAAYESDIFNAGDLLISLRNINAILVVDPGSLEVKFLSIGHFVRQHDPDFLPGDRISVFDNRNITLAPEFPTAASRIVEISALDGSARTVLSGDGETPFFTEIMGKHQRLKNGNILVVSSGEGQVLEFSPDGRLAWRFGNRVGDQDTRVYGARVLPPEMNEDFFEAQRATCQARVQQ